MCKRPEWSNEEEVRLIGARLTEPQVTINPRWLTRIILGKDMSPENQQQIRLWAKQRDRSFLWLALTSMNCIKRSA